MKIRNGFVSNSSSSSFVVACIPNQPLIIEIDLLKYGDKDKINTVEELDVYFNDNWGEDWKEHKSSFNKYNKMLTVIQSGKQIVRITGSNEDRDPISQFIYYGGINNVVVSEGIEILEYDGN